MFEVAIHLQRCDGNLTGGTPGRSEEESDSGKEGAATMKATVNKEEATGTTRSRYNELKKMLLDRRRELQAEVKGKIRDAREEGAWGSKQNEVLDAVESSEADIQDDIEFALI